ncbi:phosphomannomutase/phosphoglucomutase [Haloimpatiens sp. FM7330]|uniref:phosphomannomutase/phosphoglucomutase n=1 Tax=Haloimpatiens sp. FM7330 TaxID=3298610 RepID=UPI00362C5A8A
MLNPLDKLINENDIRGVALEGVEGESVNLTEDMVKVLGAAFVKWLSNKKQIDKRDLKISVGRDSRLSGEKLKDAIIDGITNNGANVYDCGLASTPAMFMSTVLEGYEYDGAIMITASHLPFNRNGLKLFTKEGAIEKSDLKQIVDIAKSEADLVNKQCGSANTIDFISIYAKVLVEKIREGVNSKVDKLQPLKDFKIIVDAGNGCGGFYVNKVLKELGANTFGSQFIEPDGRFPNHIPNPEDEEAMHSIKEAVIKNKADLGIIFDTDVDRAAIVDSYGNEINRNRLIALISAIILEEHPKTTIVTDSVTSVGLKQFIEDIHGGKHHRFKRGYKNVINEAIRLNKSGAECHIAIETSGHAALKENYFLDDGAYLISKILVKMAKLKHEKNENLHELIKDLKEANVSVEYRIKIKCENFKDYGTKILNDLEEYCTNKEGWKIEVPNYEGVRVKCGDAWFLMRLSLHDPVMPINLETNSQKEKQDILKCLLDFLSKYQDLDISVLKKNA